MPSLAISAGLEKRALPEQRRPALDKVAARRHPR
jgi:hypothetical protein